MTTIIDGIPRITPEDIKSEIVSQQYHRFPGTNVTVCCVTLRNGFNAVGSSACADDRLFDPDLGEQIALKDAEGKLWPLLGYELCSNIAAGRPG